MEKKCVHFEPESIPKLFDHYQGSGFLFFLFTKNTLFVIEVKNIATILLWREKNLNIIIEYLQISFIEYGRLWFDENDGDGMLNKPIDDKELFLIEFLVKKHIWHSLQIGFSWKYLSRNVWEFLE